MRHIVYSTKPADFDKFFTMDPAITRVLYYNGTIQKQYTEHVLYIDEEKVCFSYNTIKVSLSKSGKLYSRRTSDSGYTYNKKTKKGKAWFGKPFALDDLWYPALKEHYNLDLDWISDIKSSSTLLSSNSVISGILSGKITNCRDMVKTYLKYHARGLKMSPEALYKYLKRSKSNWRNLKHLISSAYYFTDPNDVLNNDNLVEAFGDEYEFDDIIRQAKSLNRKINGKWSPSRMKEVHKQWTNDLMAIELEFMEEEVIEYEGTLKPFMDFRLINTRKELFKVGTIEGHCVYTNYWNGVKYKSDFILYGEYEGVMYTASIRFQGWRSENYYEIGQVHKAHNQGAPENLKRALDSWVMLPEVQEFFYINEGRPMPKIEANTSATTFIDSKVFNEL